MAAGRGEFFRSMLEGLDRLPAHLPSVRPQPGRGRGRPVMSQGKLGGRRKKRQPKLAPSSDRSDEHSCPEQGTVEKKTGFPKRKACLCEENFLERLPSEILIRIFSFLDASSLFCISHVSKLFHQLANDDVMWEKIYMSEFGSQTWRPKLDDAVVEKEPVEVEYRSTGHWKMTYFKAVAGREVNMWRRALRDVSPHTGVPRQTESVLRNLNVGWELTVCDFWGRGSTMEASRVYFFESSLIVCWSRGRFPNYHHISNIQLHGVRKETMRSPKDKKPGWRSLILNLDPKTQPRRFIGRDRLIKLVNLQPGVVIGIWRGQSSVAFILATLHFHKLVEKSLLGSSVCPYPESVDRPPVDTSDPEFGLHGYTLDFVLHNTRTEIMSGRFRNLSCSTGQIQNELVELRIIDRINFSQHRSLSGNVRLPWKSEELDGSVENCCIMTLTLLDVFQKPFWCVSSPVSITMAKRPLSYDYSGEPYLMGYYGPDGQVKMQLVWLKEEKQFFLISLTLYISVSKVNLHFSREY